MYEQIASNKRRTVFLLVFFLALLWALGWVIGKATGNPGLLFFIGIFSIAYSIISYFTGAKMALAVNRAREIQKADDPRLWRTVENLAITDGLPMPKVYIMDDPAPNAFATGRDYNHSAVCATSGLLQIMDDNELQGVIAHELGHVKNYDMRVNTLAFALVGVISLIADFFLRFTFWGGDREERNNGPLLALASALEKLEQTGSATRVQNTSTAHMFFANPLKGHSFLNLFSTHPPLEARIKVLREMKL
jgi:heat shock protein HtpX